MKRNSQAGFCTQYLQIVCNFMVWCTRASRPCSLTLAADTRRARPCAPNSPEEGKGRGGAHAAESARWETMGWSAGCRCGVGGMGERCAGRCPVLESECGGRFYATKKLREVNGVRRCRRPNAKSCWCTLAGFSTSCASCWIAGHGARLYAPGEVPRGNRTGGKKSTDCQMSVQRTPCSGCEVPSLCPRGIRRRCWRASFGRRCRNAAARSWRSSRRGCAWPPRQRRRRGRAVR